MARKRRMRKQGLLNPATATTPTTVEPEATTTKKTVVVETVETDLTTRKAAKVTTRTKTAKAKTDED